MAGLPPAGLQPYRPLPATKGLMLTAFPSFVAVDRRVRLENGQVATVEQPLPLPEGVSDLAVRDGSCVGKAVSSLSVPHPSSALQRALYDLAKPFQTLLPTQSPIEWKK